MTQFAYNLPIFLTLVRLVTAPLIIPVLCVLYLPANSFKLNLLVALLFVSFCLTDFLDGYLARKYKQETVIGRLLDPLADKFLLFSSLIGLVYIHKIFYFWAIIFIGREFFIMGLREVALYFGFTISVSPLGKLKTIAQQAYITAVILNHAGNIALLENILLVGALFLTVYSAWDYALEFRKTWLKKSREI